MTAAPMDFHSSEWKFTPSGPDSRSGLDEVPLVRVEIHRAATTTHGGRR